MIMVSVNLVEYGIGFSRLLKTKISTVYFPDFIILQSCLIKKVFSAGARAFDQST